ncbi:hypothetical protein AYJ09_01470 [Candidatus Liberibacter solanacearum]|uniref:hypothetical protein n=1 Tax=Candidatus Liberibacter solanacearum TaxID=556287 RepID=UPI000978F5EF|nr:hypothetical protein [Candidatus Liberibacter solanacearum]ONI59082.1 hypothetical protein AYJ09_01470 [Candidatus Liberibacter solanacearum]
MPKQQTKDWWSKGLSNIFQGATSGAMVGGPWGALAGGLAGGGLSVIDYLFSDSDQEEEKQGVVEQPAYMLTDKEREREEERADSWMNRHSYSQYRTPVSPFLTGAVRR